MSRPHESVCIAVIDAIVSMNLDDDGGVDRHELETTALRREEFAKLALDRYCQDQPMPGSEGAKYNAITDGLLLLGNEAVTWLLAKGHLAETGNRVRWGKPLKVNGKHYVPGTAREEDLWHSIRRVTPKRLDLIRESMAELGDLREYFPVLLDENGDVVDGRHRLAIDETWPAMRIKVPLDKRVAAAVAANRSNAWTAEDWQRLRHHRELTHGKHEAVRFIARLALLEDHERPDREIARVTGMSKNTVAAVRGELENIGQIDQFNASAGRPRSDGTPAQPRRKLSAEDIETIIAEDLGWPAIMERFGVGQAAAQSGRTWATATADERRRAKTIPTSLPAPFATGAEMVTQAAADEPVSGEVYDGPYMPEASAPVSQYVRHACPVCGYWHEDARG